MFVGADAASAAATWIQKRMKVKNGASCPRGHVAMDRASAVMLSLVGLIFATPTCFSPLRSKVVGQKWS